MKYFLKIISGVKFYLEYFFLSLRPYRVVVGKVAFNVRYRPFWKAVNMGKWEPETFTVFEKFLDKEHSFIDVGAWIGPTALYGSKLAKGCYAIEPDPVAFKELSGNVALNPDLRALKIFELCISDKNGTAGFGNMADWGDSMSSLLFSGSLKSREVKSMTLQKFVEQNDVKDLNFIKMDIEGGETIVLPNIKPFLEEHKPALFLSLHPQFFRNPKQDHERIADVLKIYKYVYDAKGRAIALDSLFSEPSQKKKGRSIVATDIAWH